MGEREEGKGEEKKRKGWKEGDGREGGNVLGDRCPCNSNKLMFDKHSLT